GVPPWRVAAKWSALGLAVGGLGLGTTELFVADQRRKSFDNAVNMSCTNVGGRALHRSDGSAAPECQSLLSAFESARRWEIVGFVAGGAFAATWLVLALTET